MTDYSPYVSFLVNQLTPRFNTKEQIQNLCLYHAKDLNGDFISDKPAFLFALSGNETSFGIQSRPRHEANYGPGGIYYTNKDSGKQLRSLYQDYGAMISCSWGPWQLMAIIPYEKFNYPGHPAELHNGMVSAPYVVEYLNFLISRGANTIEMLAASYNAGPGAIKDPNRWPKKYVNDFMQIYNTISNKQ